MCTTDIRDVYYSVKINEELKCHLKFQWKRRLLKFTCLDNGSGSCPRRFTKITKVPCSDLWVRGIPNSAFMGDIFIKGKSYSANKVLKI